MLKIIGGIRIRFMFYGNDEKCIDISGKQISAQFLGNKISKVERANVGLAKAGLLLFT